MNTFDNILYLLKSKKKTQRELAEYLGITEFKVSHWRNGRSQTYSKYVPQIAEFLGVSVEEVIGVEKKDDIIDLDEQRKARMLYETLLNAGIDIKTLSQKDIERVITLIKVGLDK